MVRLQAAPRNLLHRRVNIHTQQRSIHTQQRSLPANQWFIPWERLGIRGWTLLATVTHAHARAHARKTCGSPSFARIKQWTTPVTTISINYPATDRRLAFPRTSITCRSLTRRETWPRSLSSDESPLERRVCIERRLPPRKNWSNILAGGGSAIVAVRQRS